MPSPNSFAKQLYSEFFKDLSWSNSPLNAWLNTEFITNAFTEEEQNNILECENEAQGKASTEKIFLLNNEEAEKYSNDEKDRIAFTIDGNVPDSWELRDGNIVDRDKYHYIVLHYVKFNGEFESYPVHEGDLVNIRPGMWISTEN